MPGILITQGNVFCVSVRMYDKAKIHLLEMQSMTKCEARSLSCLATLLSMMQRNAAGHLYGTAPRTACTNPPHLLHDVCALRTGGGTFTITPFVFIGERPTSLTVFVLIFRPRHEPGLHTAGISIINRFLQAADEALNQCLHAAQRPWDLTLAARCFTSLLSNSELQAFFQILSGRMVNRQCSHVLHD